MHRRILGVAVVLACGCAPRGPSHHTLHVVDGQTVYSTPPPTAAYAAYLRARLALDATPPRLDEARAQIDAALAVDPRDPQLWTVRAEIAALAGDGAAAVAAVKRALAISPDYPAARRLEARLGHGSSVADN